MVLLGARGGFAPALQAPAPWSPVLERETAPDGTLHVTVLRLRRPTDLPGERSARVTSMSGSVVLEWRSPVGDDEVVALGRARPGWWDRVRPHSLGWVVARDGGRLVGFVNVAWDGADHAFLLDPVVVPEYRRRGIATRLVELAVFHARQVGCEWMHVDFEEHLREFYLGADGFRASAAGLLDLRGAHDR